MLHTAYRMLALIHAGRAAARATNEGRQRSRLHRARRDLRLACRVLHMLRLLCVPPVHQQRVQALVLMLSTPAHHLLCVLRVLRLLCVPQLLFHPHPLAERFLISLQLPCSVLPTGMYRQKGSSQVRAESRKTSFADLSPAPSLKTRPCFHDTDMFNVLCLGTAGLWLTYDYFFNF